MSAAGTPLSPGDLQRTCGSAGWRTHRIQVFRDASAGRVLVKDQRAEHPPRRRRMLNGSARLAGLALRRAALSHGVAPVQRIELLPLRRAQSLATGWPACIPARALRVHGAAQQAAAIETLRAELEREHAPVRALVAEVARRLYWVWRLPDGNGRGWRRHIAILRSAVTLMLAAQIPEETPALTPR